jgi:hypothetical protein
MNKAADVLYEEGTGYRSRKSGLTAVILVGQCC